MSVRQCFGLARDIFAEHLKAHAGVRHAAAAPDRVLLLESPSFSPPQRPLRHRL